MRLLYELKNSPERKKRMGSNRINVKNSCQSEADMAWKGKGTLQPVGSCAVRRR